MNQNTSTPKSPKPSCGNPVTARLKFAVEERRTRVIGLYLEGKTMRQIGRLVDLPVSAVHGHIKAICPRTAAILHRRSRA